MRGDGLATIAGPFDVGLCLPEFRPACPRVWYTYQFLGSIEVNYYSEGKPTEADVVEARQITRAIVEGGGGRIVEGGRIEVK